jgi:tetraacyldisaccharide 4'-kinase
VLRAHIAPTATQSWQGQRVVAFAGIGQPDKFFASLIALGAEIVATARFADHHFFTGKELDALQTQARAAQAQLVTTEKDFVRLTPAQRGDIAILPVSATIEPLAALDRLLDSICSSL